MAEPETGHRKQDRLQFVLVIFVHFLVAVLVFGFAWPLGKWSALALAMGSSQVARLPVAKILGERITTTDLVQIIGIGLGSVLAAVALFDRAH